MLVRFLICNCSQAEYNQFITDGLFTWSSLQLVHTCSILASYPGALTSGKCTFPGALSLEKHFPDVNVPGYEASSIHVATLLTTPTTGQLSFP